MMTQGYNAPGYGQYGGYTGGYTPPSYGYNAYPNAAQNVMQQTQERLQNVTNQAQQYLQNPQGQQQPQQAPQAQQISVAVVTSIDQVKAAAPDLSGARRMFYDTSADKIYTRQFNMGTGLEEFHTYERQAVQAPPVETAPEAPVEEVDPEPVKPTADEKIQELNCQLSALASKYNDLEEKLNEYASNREHDVADKPAGGAVDAAGAGDGADGKPAGGARKPVAAKPKQSDAAKPSGQK